MKTDFGLTGNDLRLPRTGKKEKSSGGIAAGRLLPIEVYYALFSDVKFCQFCTDLIENRNKLVGCRDVEIVIRGAWRIARAALEQGRRALDHQDRVNFNSCALGIGTSGRHAIVDRRLVTAETVLGIVTVREEDDDVLVGVVRILCRD
jgi:hypothetical protein